MVELKQKNAERIFWLLAIIFLYCGKYLLFGPENFLEAKKITGIIGLLSLGIFSPLAIWGAFLTKKIKNN